MTYTEYISQFSIVDNPSKSTLDGYSFHHIVPVSYQKKLYGGKILDNRCVLLKYSEHGYAHWLFDKENNTKTATGFLVRVPKSVKDISGYEDFKILDNQPWISEETRRKMSISQSEARANNRYSSTVGQSWWTNGEEETFAFECPGEDWIRGRNTSFTNKFPKDRGLHISMALKGKPSLQKGMHWWTDGTNQVRAFECPNTGWYRGRPKATVEKVASANKGRVPWNKGLKSSN